MQSFNTIKISSFIDLINRFYVVIKKTNNFFTSSETIMNEQRKCYSPNGIIVALFLLDMFIQLMISLKIERASSNIIQAFRISCCPFLSSVPIFKN